MLNTDYESRQLQHTHAMQGVRTFLESEVTKSSKRMDLLQKMVELDPDEPTEDERQTGITKLRCAHSHSLFRRAPI